MAYASSPILKASMSYRSLSLSKSFSPLVAEPLATSVPPASMRISWKESLPLADTMANASPPMKKASMSVGSSR